MGGKITRNSKTCARRTVIVTRTSVAASRRHAQVKAPLDSEWPCTVAADYGGNKPLDEHQYYEFQAIDQPLDDADRRALRIFSARARITRTSLTVHYDWGDFKGNPNKLMRRWFDLHVYVGYGSGRRLMIRVPKRLIDRGRLESVLRGAGIVDIIDSEENLILDVFCEFEPSGYEDWDDGAGWMAALAPLRGELLAGDMRMAYMLWLWGVETGRVPDDEQEPLGGIGPLSGGLEALAEFLEMGADLVAATAEAPANSAAVQPSPEAIRATIMAIPETEKAILLQRLAEGDPHVAAEVQKRVRDAVSAEARPKRRTVAELLARAEEIGKAREAAAAIRREEERLEQKRRDEQLRRALLDYLRRRGSSVWREIEAEIDKRVHTSYDRAARLIFDLRDLAEEDGALADFSNRLNALRARHHRKTAFLRRLAKLDHSDKPDD